MKKTDKICWTHACLSFSLLHHFGSAQKIARLPPRGSLLNFVFSLVSAAISIDLYSLLNFLNHNKEKEFLISCIYKYILKKNR